MGWFCYKDLDSHIYKASTSAPTHLAVDHVSDTGVRSLSRLGSHKHIGSSDAGTGAQQLLQKNLPHESRGPRDKNIFSFVVLRNGDHPECTFPPLSDPWNTHLQSCGVATSSSAHIAPSQTFHKRCQPNPLLRSSKLLL